MRFRRGGVLRTQTLNQASKTLERMSIGVTPSYQVSVTRPSMQDHELLVVLRAFHNDDPGSRFAFVQEVKPVLDQGTWTGQMQAVGATILVNVWPPMTCRHFAPFIWQAAELDDRTTILPLTRIGGVWWLKQRPMRAVSMRHGPVRMLDCAPFEATAP